MDITYSPNLICEKFTNLDARISVNLLEIMVIKGMEASTIAYGRGRGRERVCTLV